MAFREYGNYDGVGLADLVRKKQVSAAELLDEAIARTAKVDPEINAVVVKHYDYARRHKPGSSDAGNGCRSNLVSSLSEAQCPRSSAGQLWLLWRQHVTTGALAEPAGYLHFPRRCLVGEGAAQLQIRRIFRIQRQE